MLGRLRIFPFLPLLSIGFRHVSVVHAISTYLGGWARRRGYRGRIEIVPNGVDVKLFFETPSSEFLGIKKRKGDVFLVTTSRLVNKNAVDDVIRALALLPDYVHFIIM